MGRSDGRRVRDLPLLRRFMPFIMPRRNDSVVYFEQTVRVDRTLEYLDAQNAKGGPKLSFFHVVLAAATRALKHRPHMHRFIVGRKVYDRNAIDLSFAVKKAMTDGAKLTTVKVRMDPDEPLSRVPARIDAQINVGRSEETTTSEKEMAVVSALPGFLLRFVMWAQGVLDARGLLPRSMIKNDPMYASIFLANLGSVGLDSPFHHLYEYGNVSIFMAIGNIHDAPVVDDGQLAVGKVCKIRYSFDERVADGYYAARGLDMVQGFIEDPSVLESEE